ncbi:hypothetical protein C1X05_07970 [Laceyella sacchari]|nr:hypothetical protein C1X05_07970 [Laceyella sacchari]
MYKQGACHLATAALVTSFSTLFFQLFVDTKNVKEGIMVISFTPLDSSRSIAALKQQYLNSLVAPMDGMWESAIIGNANNWAIHYEGKVVGYFCTDEESRLLQFYIMPPYQSHYRTIFVQLIEQIGISSAFASTIEPLYLSLCLDFHNKVHVKSYLFTDLHAVQLPPFALQPVIFRLASHDELTHLERFYKEYIEGDGSWIHDFLQERISQMQLYALYHDDTLLGTGECIESKTQPPYADIGIVVNKQFRNRGIGTYILNRLKHQCYKSSLKPICSCTAENIASRKAIEKAGFVSYHRILEIFF